MTKSMIPSGYSKYALKRRTKTPRKLMPVRICRSCLCKVCTCHVDSKGFWRLTDKDIELWYGYSVK